MSDLYRIMKGKAYRLADTVATLPDSIALVPGQPYLWSVEARIGWDRWTTSPLTAFSVVPAPRR